MHDVDEIYANSYTDEENSKLYCIPKVQTYRNNILITEINLYEN